MQVQAILKYARISAFKAREVTREIQGKPVADALDLCRFTPRKAARLIEKTLKSAIANAENNNNLSASDLFVQEAVVGEGPTIKRYAARARGSGTLIRKRTSHIRIVLTNDPELAPSKQKEKKPAARSKAAAKTSKTKSAPAAQEPAATGE